MMLAMNMAKTNQSCLKDFVQTKFRKIMLPKNKAIHTTRVSTLLIVDRVFIHSFRAGCN